MSSSDVSRKTAKAVGALFAAVVATACLAASAGATPAGLGGCGYDTSHPFLPWLDPAPYALLPSGGFESGATGWRLSGGAKVVSGNEPWYVSGRGSRSLSLPSGSSATSAPVCVELVLPTVRFFVSGGASLSSLRVEALYTDALGRERSIALLPDASPSSGWAPSLQMVQLGGALDAATLDGSTAEIQLRFTPVGGLLGSGTWRIDDVYVDPWKNI